MSLSIKVKPLILIGCEGSGRSAIMFHLLRKFPHKFQRVISHTTRRPRQSEVNQRDYYFVNGSYVTDNIEKFVTLTKSSNGHYYGLISDEIMRVIKNNKIPIFKMTLEGYSSNINKEGGLQIKQQGVESNSNPVSKSIHFLKRNKLIECNSLYVTVPDISELERRFRFSPLEESERKQRLERAKKEQSEFERYFEEDDVIRSEEDMDKTIKMLQSRLFQLY